jgi:hypothetical protein
LEEREREKGEGKTHSSPTLAQGLLNGIPYAGWWRDREMKREGGKLPFGREQDQFRNLWDVPLIAWKSQLQVLLTWLKSLL